MPPSQIQTLLDCGNIRLPSVERQELFVKAIRAMAARLPKPRNRGRENDWFVFLPGETTQDRRSFTVTDYLHFDLMGDDLFLIRIQGYVNVLGHEDRRYYDGSLKGSLSDPSTWEFEFSI